MNVPVQYGAPDYCDPTDVNSYGGEHEREMTPEEEAELAAFEDDFDDPDEESPAPFASLSPGEEQLRIEQWLLLRSRSIDEAGNRCEYRHDANNRCVATEQLQVHHGNDGGLQVFCALHHVTKHLLNKTCLRCGEPVFDDSESAEDFAADFAEPGGIDENPLLYAMDAAPGFCGYCTHMAGKDD